MSALQAGVSFLFRLFIVAAFCANSTAKAAFRSAGLSEKTRDQDAPSSQEALTGVNADALLHKVPGRLLQPRLDQLGDQLRREVEQIFCGRVRDDVGGFDAAMSRLIGLGLELKAPCQGDEHGGSSYLPFAKNLSFLCQRFVQH